MRSILSREVCPESSSTEFLDFDFFLHPGFSDPSALLKHELAYCLGQMKKISALPALEAVLRDSSEDPMVRHEVSPDIFILLDLKRKSFPTFYL